MEKLKYDDTARKVIHAVTDTCSLEGRQQTDKCYTWTPLTDVLRMQIHMHIT